MPTSRRTCHHCHQTSNIEAIGTSQGVIYLALCCCDHLHCRNCHSCVPPTHRTCRCGDAIN